MAGTSSVPAIDWQPTGPVLPAESAILTGVQQDMNAAFGGNMSSNLSTPQGQVAQSTTAIVGSKNDDILAVVNGMDPDLASGRMQDAIGRIYFIDRNPAEPTTVIATCVGQVDTPIPVGARAIATDNSVYICTQDGKIPASGSIDLTFQCQTNGPIACPAGSLNRIYQQIPGWDTINNAADGVLGADVESRADFEYRRRQSVAKNSSGMVPSVRGAVLGVSNVLDAYVTDNGTGSSVVVGGVTLIPHSLYVCVAGGATQDIGSAIWSKKAPGCDYNGSTSVTVYDTDGYTAPFPQYTVKFQIASGLPVFFSVNIVDNGALPADIETQVKAAIKSAFSGSDGGQRARIGRDMLASRYYGPVEAIDDNLELDSIYIGISANPSSGNRVPVNINQIPTIDDADIAVNLIP
ncbi:baseplate J/gp47 family protein [Pandoraea sputorum]|uniref:Bacteriophage protein n=1 Tax=Pandoraea sputorum TaxID=93222 RepID=A0A5E5BCY7_9BURK|nr:baseplate J/gp47 family protein [Pandoraea sputorum]VVE82825.1 bacteriophage protein [Pandoraea sputorum]